MSVSPITKIARDAFIAYRFNTSLVSKHYLISNMK